MNPPQMDMGDMDFGSMDMGDMDFGSMDMGDMGSMDWAMGDMDMDHMGSMDHMGMTDKDWDNMSEEDKQMYMDMMNMDMDMDMGHMDWNMTDMDHMNMDWNMTDMDHMMDWNMTDYNMTDYDYMMDYNMSDYDYNMTDYDYTKYMDCGMQCESDWCDHGEYCTITTCFDACMPDMMTCKMEWLTKKGDWREADCADPKMDMEDYCDEPFCEYNDCSEGRDEICWMEECFDGCDLYNCTLWKSENDVWYGEECPQAALGAGDLANAAKTMQQTGLAYADTIQTVFGTLCPPGDA